MAAPTSVVDTVVSLCKRRGFVFPCGEIYGGTRSAWDYGPLGVELKENIKRQWWRSMVTAPRGRRRARLLDHPAPPDLGRLGPRRRRSPTRSPSARAATSASAPTTCRRPSPSEAKKGKEVDPDSVALADIACPNCGTRGQWTEPRNFNMMLKTYLGVIEDESGLHYLRPETAQGIFINFLNVSQASRKKPPFGIAQTGKSFRNEITPGNFIFRTREFEQMEMEFFVKPGEDEQWHQYWIDERAALVHRPRHRPREPAHLRAPGREAVALLQAHRRHRVPLQLHRQRVGRARGHRQPHRLRPHDALASTPAPTWSTSTRRPARSTRPTSSSPRPACRAR